MAYFRVSTESIDGELQLAVQSICRAAQTKSEKFFIFLLYSF